jgi:hypothetical protein
MDFEYFSGGEEGEYTGDIENKINILNEFIQPATPRYREEITTVRRKKGATKKSSPAAKAVKIYDSYDCDEKIREKIRHVAARLIETRPYLTDEYHLTADQLYRRTLDFLSERGYWNMDSIKDKYLIAIYSVLMSCRLHGIFLDHHILALDMGVSFKLLQKCIYKCSPPVTSTNELDIRITKIAIETNKYELRREYVNFLRKIVQGISPEEVARYERACKMHFDTINLRGVCDEERQFCVSADKIFIYGIFETCKRLSPEKTERVICEQLAETFSVPRVTIEKMKRLIHKSFAEKID